MFCKECDQRIKEDDSPGVYLHQDEDGDTDYDQDALHVAIPYIPEEPLKPEEQYLLLPFLKSEPAQKLVAELGGWYLYLDDQIHDLNAIDRKVPTGFLGAASTVEAIALVERLGPPILIDFDHDLGYDADGNELTAKEFCKWLYENYPDNPPKQWKIHSRNISPDAGGWIDSYLRSWIRSLKM